ncbi:ChaN family lipoprotein [Cohaesibacter gelatinilyticus]|uniref:Uncharacterized iron-regulated protein n=1 Tax=Cohaesibacter gelatinilyticus TaxID=372072 RepID=A0A285NEL8_9HYPH|nr:ChaN family lipoprotein [Cohaesibacter gelatinilyticus]SNZ06091.1 Uncharacterized iron-regulated protein [Cohaesibacter gelatinilyticus]
MPISRFAPIACLLGLFLANDPAVNMSAFAGERSEPKESALLLSDHPLVDTIWNTSTSASITKKALTEQLHENDYVLLGEKHDNVRHHSVQAELSASVMAHSSKPAALVFEMLEPAHQDILDQADSFSLAELGKKVEWEKRGWPSWASYQPIFESGLKAGSPIFAGNPDRATIMDVGRGGKLPESDLVDLRWDQDYGDGQRESLLTELVDSHCGMMGRESMGPLVTLQRLKDAYMGRAIRRAGNERPVVLIAGNGHVRKDRGVPFFLDGDKKTVSVAIIEVARDQLEASSYSAFDPKLYDYVWFTPRVDEIDPCDKFREQLERMKQKMKTKSGTKDHGKS